MAIFAIAPWPSFPQARTRSAATTSRTVATSTLSAPGTRRAGILTPSHSRPELAILIAIATAHLPATSRSESAGLRERTTAPDLGSTRIVNDLPPTHRQNRSYLQLTRGFGQRAVRDSGNPRASGRGVLIYWHVERKSMAIHSQLIGCSASEVAAMIEGVMRHGTTMEMDASYTDSHGLVVTWTPLVPPALLASGFPGWPRGGRAGSGGGSCECGGSMTARVCTRS